MTSHHPAELDSTDSVTSSPRSDYHRTDDEQPRVRFMCSFGGKILPRPHDNQLRYVGGATHIVAVPRHGATFASLLAKLSKLTGTTNISVKYQLPSEDLDSLITVTGDEDLENMMEEYDRLAGAGGKSSSSRLRLFLFSNDSVSSASSISSLLDGSTKREHWFLDALNGGGAAALERGRSEVSSIVSEVPDYLFGWDNSDDPPRAPKLKARSNLADNVSVSDPGSPAPVVSSPFCSTSSSLAPPCLPELRPVKTKPDNPAPVVEAREAQVESSTETNEPPINIQQTGYPGNMIWPHFPGQALQHMPLYYMPGMIPPGNVPVQQVAFRAPYVQPFPASPGQVPVGFHQQDPPIPAMGPIYGGEVRQGPAVDMYDMPARVPVLDGAGQPVYYGVKNSGMVPMYLGMAVPGGEDPGNGNEGRMGRVTQV